MSNIEKIVARQEAYYAHDAREWRKNPLAKLYGSRTQLLDLGLPRYPRYALCNLRGGIGKTTLTFNLAYDTDQLLVIDSCPQGNLSSFFDKDFFTTGASLFDALIPYFIPNMPNASGISRKISATNPHFAGKSSFFISSSPELYEFPTIMEGALAQARNLPANLANSAKIRLLTSMLDVIEHEAKTTATSRCLIDTSPFFAGATHLSWYAAPALLVPVRTDQQSVNSFQLLIDMLSNPNRSYLKIKNGITLPAPKIQLVLVTHCGWSTKKGAKNQPNSQTRVYLEKVRQIVERNIVHFTTTDPDNHIVPIDDFLGSGRIASLISAPIKTLEPNQRHMVSGEPTFVNESVEKCKRQLSFISENIWS